MVTEDVRTTDSVTIHFHSMQNGCIKSELFLSFCLKSPFVLNIWWLYEILSLGEICLWN